MRSSAPASSPSRASRRRTLSISASTNRRPLKSRPPWAASFRGVTIVSALRKCKMRVGDYAFDNTNYTGGGFGGSRYDLGRFPLENSYPVLRRYLWLEADSAYKGAVEALSRKRAALRNMTQSEKLNDFAHAEPVHHVAPFQHLTMDQDAWTDKVRSLSALFYEVPRHPQLLGRSGSQRWRLHHGQLRRLRSEGARERGGAACARRGAVFRRHDGARRGDLPGARMPRASPPRRK